jgi:hypothetical protein
MTRKQKLILIILGVLNLVVIGALAVIIGRAMTATPTTPPAVVQAQISPCMQRILDTVNALPEPFRAAPRNNAATVAWDTTQLYITLYAVYPSATPPPESAQLLWTALDEVKAVLLSGCYIPDTITIALTAHGNAETVQYLAQLAGQDVAAWMAGTLSEENLAAQSRFRQTQ